MGRREKKTKKTGKVKTKYVADGKKRGDAYPQRGEGKKAHVSSLHKGGEGMARR